MNNKYHKNIDDKNDKNSFSITNSIQKKSTQRGTDERTEYVKTCPLH